MNPATTSPISTFHSSGTAVPDVVVPHVISQGGVVTQPNESNSKLRLQRTSERVDPPQLAGSPYLTIKPWLDRLVTIGLSLLALPLLITTALLVALLDGRPIFYRQTRVGRNGQHFRIWKFRTMQPNAERETGAVWSHQHDPRVTKLGRWLRCTHLDELPQFFNILAGEMNLIGPRPERPEFVCELERDIPQYRDRLAVRPGITGLAQLRLGYDQSVAEVFEKVALDRHYIQTATFAGDIALLLGTIPYLLKRVLRKTPGTVQVSHPHTLVADASKNSKVA